LRKLSVVRKKSVLFLASWYPSRENESLGNFVQRHAEAANKVADVTVIYAISSQSCTSIEFDRNTINGVDTLIIYYPKVKSIFPVWKQFLSKKNYLDALKKGYAHLKIEFDMIHLNEAFPAGLFAIYLKKNFSLNYLLTVHWTGYLDHTKSFEKLPFFTRNLHKKIFHNASLVLPVSEHLGKSLVKLNLIKNFEVVPNAVNAEMFYPETEKKSNSITRFIHVSSFDDKHKNVVEMLQAFKYLQDQKSGFFLHLITEGNKEYVWDLINTIGIDPVKCKVKEKAKPFEVAKAMRESDCLVLYSNFETFSVVIAEAWMSGIPAIYSRCGGLTEIFNPELGVQIEKNNLKSLTNALLNFKINNFDKVRIVSESKAFKISEIAKKLSRIYSKY
jgi:glycosyltransferase involved in cell wall biosynthesis